MPVPASINDLSTIAGNNSPAGSESPTLTDDYLRTLSAFIASLRDSGTSIDELAVKKDSSAATGAAILPPGTTAQRPASPQNGMLRYNTDLPDFEGYIGGAWVARSVFTRAVNEAPIVTLASAATVNIGAAAANTINITGTTTITAFDTIASGARRILVFAGVLTLTYNATSLILPGAANINTAAGDMAEFVSLGSGNWRCIRYVRDAGIPSTMTQRAAQASTSGTAIDFTGIPSWVKRVAVYFDGVSTNGTSDVAIQLGTAGGIVATGYVSSATALTSAASTVQASNQLRVANAGSAADIRTGSVSINNMSGDVWLSSGVLSLVNVASTQTSAGKVSLGGALTTLRVKTGNGTDQFDAGTINIMYEE